MIRYTVKDIMREGPCEAYSRSRVRALWGWSESLSPADIARLPIPIAGRMWALWHLLFRLSPPRACRVARLVAFDVLDLWDPPDIVVWFLGTGDEQARATAQAESRTNWDAWGFSWETWSSPRNFARASVWFASLSAIFPAAAYADKAVGPVRASTMKRYLSWVVKAFDPFTPVGDLL